MDNVFVQMSVLLGITVTLAFVIRLLRQPLIVAYIVSGIIAGPVFFNIIHTGSDLLHALGQFGIVLLLFVVGLSLNFTHLKRVGKDVFVGGALQFLLTAGIGFLALILFRMNFVSAAFIAVALTFSSTIIIVKLLGDKRDLETVYGRYVVGLLVIQDLIAITLMLFFTSSEGNFLWYEVLILTSIKAICLAAGVYLVARHLLPLFMPRVARSNELMFIFTIAWCFGIASLVYLLGFSLEIGAIIAGATLGASPYQPEIASRIRPLRDFFIVLFFIGLGSQLPFENIGSVLMIGLFLSGFVLFFDPIILYMITRFMGYTRRNSFLIAITAAQVSEFGFILAFKGVEKGFLSNEVLSILTIVALTTIVISSYLIEYNGVLYKKLLPIFNLFGKDRNRTRYSAGEVPTFKVWVFGYHRLGWKICETLQKKKIKFAVVDFNPRTIDKLQEQGIPAYFGDAADVEFLSELPLSDADLVISTLPAVDDQVSLVNHIRTRSKDPFVIVTLYHLASLHHLYKVGANYVMMPHLLGGSWLSELLMKKNKFSGTLFKKLQKEQEKEMEVWEKNGK